MKKNQFVRDIKEKDPIQSPFLVKFSAVGLGKNGKPFMNLILMDKSGEVEAKIWEDVTQYAGQAVRDALVGVEGRCQVYQGRRQVVVQKLQILREDEVELKDFLPESWLDADALYEKLLQFIDSMQDPDYKAVCEAVFKEDSEIREKVKRAPAAKSMHHAYKTGLLEHVVSISTILDALSQHYGPILNRDLLLLGGFFHDIGKIWELSYERVTDYSDEGKLIGHLVMGVELIEKKIQLLEKEGGRLSAPSFPVEKKLLAKHMVLAHHGKLEYGSPKEPHCLEALVVHMIDDLDSKVNAIHRFIAQDQTPGRWTALNRQFERFFYKGASI